MTGRLDRPYSKTIVLAFRGFSSGGQGQLRNASQSVGVFGEPAAVTVREVDQRIHVNLAGRWTIDHAKALDEALLADPRLQAVAVAEIDLTGLTRLDAAGAYLIHRTERVLLDQGADVSIIGGEARHRALIAVAGNGVATLMKPEQSRNRVASAFALIGAAVAGIAHDTVDLTGFLGRVTVAGLNAALHPGRFRWTSFVHHIEHIGFRALPIISLICLLIGAVVMQQGALQLQPYGADLYAVNLVGILSLREIGVLLTSIMVAGRSGAAITAEIGAMKMREEVDALRVLGLDPVATLVLPRLAALLVALPILTFVGDLMCLGGGFLVAKFRLGLDLSEYAGRLQTDANLQHFLVGMIKAPFAAIAIGLIGAVEGLKVRGSAESLGLRTTAAVVKAIFVVIVLDAVFALFLSSLGI